MKKKQEKKRTNKGHIDEFVEMQGRQYTPWKYYSEGRVNPADTGDANPFLWGVFVSVLGVFVFIAAIAVVVFDPKILNIICASVVVAFYTICAMGYFRKHRQRKAEIEKQMRVKNNSRKKTKRTNKNKR